MNESSSLLRFDGWEEAQEHFLREGLTDGLPIIPPTPQRVRDMLDYCGLAPDDVLGFEGIRRKRFIAEKVAVSAVMAGCQPEHFPVVAAAISAVCDRSYNFHASSTSTNGIANLVVVSGPYAGSIGMNSSANLMGNGNRANAAIGRAINLAKTNFYGSVSQDMDKSTFGHSGKYSFCFAEYPEISPWPTWAEHQGFHPGASAVTVIAANAPLQLEAHGDREPEGFLTAAAHAMTGLGPSVSEVMLVISPELMSYITGAAWSRDQVSDFLYQNTRLPAGEWDRWRRMDKLEPGADRDRLIGVVADPGRIKVVPAGGDAGEFMALITSWGSSRSVTREIIVPG